MVNAIVKSIADRATEAKHYAVIVDASRKEQLAMCLCYVDVDFFPHEDFIGLYEPPDTTGPTTAL